MVPILKICIFIREGVHAVNAAGPVCAAYVGAQLIWTLKDTFRLSVPFSRFPEICIFIS